MKGLLLKDILNLKKQSRIMLLMTAFYFMLGLMYENPSFLTGMIVLLFTMLSITSFSYDDLAKWDRYALSLPVTRSELVLGKYVLAAVLAGAGTVLSFAGAMFFSFIKSPIDITEQLAVSYALFAVAMLFVSVLFPIIFKFGVEKGRMLMIAVFAVPMGAIYALSYLGISLPSEEQLTTLLIFSPVIIFVFTAVSYALSKSVYNKKEF